MFTSWRGFATKIRPVAHFNKEIIKDIEDETMHARRHPGRLRLPIYQVPEKIFDAIKIALEEYVPRILLNDGIIVTRYLRERLKPAETEEIQEKTRLLQDRAEEKYNIQQAQTINKRVLEKASREIITSLLKHTYSWSSTDFSSYLCYPYLASRSAAEYAIVRSIFTEMSIRDPSFQPRRVFDFGSGVGTVIWASQAVWENSIKEYYCIDSSGTMHDIAKKILGNGKVDGKSSIKAAVYQRQFLPISKKNRHNLVVSAFSLLELPNVKTRLETIRTLWDLTEDYLVLVELGSKAGFEVITEARDFILGYYLSPNRRLYEGHVFAPCPHDQPCPKVVKGDPCTFIKKYIPLPFDNKVRHASEKYSYVVLKKGKRDPEDPQWPRIVEPVLVRKKHAHCRMCTADGKYQDLIFAKGKYSKFQFWCARMSDWGDRLPLSKITLEEVQLDNPVTDEKLNEDTEEPEVGRSPVDDQDEIFRTPFKSDEDFEVSDPENFSNDEHKNKNS